VNRDASAARSLGSVGTMLALVVLLAAQGPQLGSIRGAVTDLSGVPLPGVRITATAEGALPQATSTDDEGRYRLDGLSPGMYELRAGALQGFCDEVRSGIQVGKDATLTIDLRMRLAPAGWTELNRPYNLRQAYRMADAVVHLRTTEGQGPTLWEFNEREYVGISHEARVLATQKIDPARAPGDDTLRFIQYPVGYWSDGTRTACGTEMPYPTGQEFVAFLAWDDGAGQFRFLNPSYMIPVTDGHMIAASWASYDVAGLADGITVEAFFDVLAAIPVDTLPIDDPETYAVYAALMPNQWSVRVAEATRLVFREEAAVDFRCRPSGPALENDWAEVFERFKSATIQPRLLVGGQQVGIPYVVVPGDEITASFRAAPDTQTFGWRNFYRRFPDSGGYMTASPVGFNGAKNRAMVYLGHSCGALCGGGGFHFLERLNGDWHEVRLPGVSRCGWAS